MSNPEIRPPLPPESPHRESDDAFLRWTVELLGIDARDADQRLVIPLSDAERDRFGGQETLEVDLQATSEATAYPGCVPLCWDGTLGHWLSERLASVGTALHARPARSPLSVSEVSEKLFAAFRVEGGRVHLAGCQLTDHPFLRLSFAHPSDGQVRHVFVAPDGSGVATELVPRLGLLELSAIEQRPPRIDPAALRSLIDAGSRLAAKQGAPDVAVGDVHATPVQPTAVTLIWVRHAQGRVQFSIGPATAYASFAGWVSLLQAEPYRGPDSGVATFHLAATDDGRIEAAEEIEPCQHSGRRVLRQELVECSVTGQRVLPEFTEHCPVAGLPTLKSEFATCAHCLQRVSRNVLEEGVCAACRQLAKIAKDDPRLIWVLGEHGGLDRWNHWRLSETENCYLLEAHGMLKRLWGVFDKQSLEVRRLATRGRFSGRWIDVPAERRAELLQ